MEKFIKLNHSCYDSDYFNVIIKYFRYLKFAIFLDPSFMHHLKLNDASLNF